VIEAFQTLGHLLEFGLIEAVEEGDAPTTLRRVTFVELNRRRAQRLQALITELLPSGELGSVDDPGEATRTSERAGLRDAGLALARGGVGYYPESDFVHLDTGPVRRW